MLIFTVQDYKRRKIVNNYHKLLSNFIFIKVTPNQDDASWQTDVQFNDNNCYY